MENFNTVPDKGTFGGSVEIVNQNFLLAQQEMEMLRQLYNSMSQSQPIPVTTLPATGEAGKIYRLAGTTSYADYMYSESDLTTPLKMAEYNNGVDSKPTAGSKNLVESGGVKKNTIGLVPVNSSDELLDKSLILINKSCTARGVVQDYDGWCVSPLIKVKTDIPLWINTYNLYIYNLDSDTSFYKYPHSLEGMPLNSISSSISAEYCNIRLEFRIDDIDTVRVGLTERMNLVKDYFGYDKVPTSGSRNLILSGDVYDYVNGAEEQLNGGVNYFNILQGERYIFTNTGESVVGIYYRVTPSSEEKRIGVGDISVGSSIIWLAPEDATIIIVSNFPSASIVVQNVDSSITKRLQYLEEEHGTIRVATFNAGDYTGKNLSAEESISAYRKLIGELGADIVGIQDDIASYQGKDIGSTFWANHKYFYRKGETTYNYKAFASDYPISFVTKIEYTGDYDFKHTYFLVGELFLPNFRILLTSFHFDWYDNDTRAEQMRQIIAYAANYDYVIMMGDTNTDNYINGVKQGEPHNLYATEWLRFSDAGYDMVNMGYFGLFNTVNYDYEEGKQEPLDNIFIKGNITVRNAGIIVKDWTNDHCVLFADLAVY